MEIKLKNYEIINAINSLQELMGSKLPVKISWNLSKNFRKLTEIIKVYNEFDQKLLDLYAVKDASGQIKVDENNQYEINPGHMVSFTKEKSELLNIGDTIDIHLIKLSELMDIEVSPTTFYGLGFMIEDDTE